MAGRTAAQAIAQVDLVHSGHATQPGELAAGVCCGCGASWPPRRRGGAPRSRAPRGRGFAPAARRGGPPRRRRRWPSRPPSRLCARTGPRVPSWPGRPAKRGVAQTRGPEPRLGAGGAGASPISSSSRERVTRVGRSGRSPPRRRRAGRARSACRRSGPPASALGCDSLAHACGRAAGAARGPSGPPAGRARFRRRRSAAGLRRARSRSRRGRARRTVRQERSRHGHDRDQPVLEARSCPRSWLPGQGLEATVDLEGIGRDGQRVLPCARSRSARAIATAVLPTPVGPKSAITAWGAATIASNTCRAPTRPHSASARGGGHRRRLPGVGLRRVARDRAAAQGAARARRHRRHEGPRPGRAPRHAHARRARRHLALGVEPVWASVPGGAAPGAPAFGGARRGADGRSPVPSWRRSRPPTRT